MSKWGKAIWIFVIIVNTASITEFIITGDNGITPYWIDIAIILFASFDLIFNDEKE